MNAITAVRPIAMALVMLTLSGCYYTGPYGYGPYYAPVPATVTQRALPVAPASPVPSVSSAPAAPTVPAAPPPADDYAQAPAYAAPAYVPYPAYYPAYYPGWYGPPVTIGLGFWGHWGGGYRGGYWRRPWGGGHWGGGHWGGGHRH